MCVEGVVELLERPFAVTDELVPVRFLCRYGATGLRLQAQRKQKSSLDRKSFPQLEQEQLLKQILAENLTLCRVADPSACNMQKHSLENLNETNLFAFERFVLSWLQVVPLFRVS